MPAVRRWTGRAAFAVVVVVRRVVPSTGWRVSSRSGGDELSEEQLVAASNAKQTTRMIDVYTAGWLSKACAISCRCGAAQ